MCEYCPEAKAKAEAEAERIAALPKRVLTRETVEAGEPCTTYRDRFEERFPKSVEVTVDLALSQVDDWDWWWAARNLLTLAGFRKYEEAVREAENVHGNTVRPYREALDRVSNPAWEMELEIERREVANGKSYGQAYRIAMAAYDKAVEIEAAAYNAVYKVANRRLEEARARAWAEIYISEEGSTEPIGYKVHYTFYEEGYGPYDESYDY